MSKNSEKTPLPNSVQAVVRYLKFTTQSEGHALASIRNTYRDAQEGPVTVELRNRLRSYVYHDRMLSFMKVPHPSGHLHGSDLIEDLVDNFFEWAHYMTDSTFSLDDVSSVEVSYPGSRAKELITLLRGSRSQNPWSKQSRVAA